MIDQLHPLVSVSTITYNHAAYIQRCIESVLMQKTTFPFEFVIGEDCSTDCTREIVLEYADKYPQIIRVITSESNVGGRANSQRTISACQGEYIAFCEGDDYWIDPLKLQKQYDACIKFNAALVAHGTFILIYKEGKLTGLGLGLTQPESGYLNVEDIILKNRNFETSSIFIRSSVVKNLPDWYGKAPSGDVPLKLIAASFGKVYFLNEIMSVYQKGVLQSWTRENGKYVNTRDMIWRSSFEKDYLEMYKNFDAFSGYRYTKAIHQRINNRLFGYLRAYENLDILDTDDAKKKTIRIIAYLSRLAPERLKNVIARSQVDKYLPFI